MNASTPELMPVNPLVNLVDVISSPRQAFQRIAAVQRGSWWLPALLCLAGALIYLIVALDATAAEAAKQIQIQMGTMPPEQVEAARPMLERFSSPAFMLGTSMVTVLISLLLGWMIATGLVYLGASITGHTAPAPAVWAVVVWTWLPFGLRGFVQAAWSAVHGGALIHYPGLSYFVATGDTAADQTNPLFLLTSQIDLFALWHLVLVYVVMRVVARMGWLSSVVFVVIYALVGIGLRMLPGLAGGMFGGA